MVPNAADAAALSVRGVGVRTSGQQILQNITLTLFPGELCAVVGPSGAGKSTFNKVLLGLKKPSEGTVALGQVPPERAGPIGYVPQDDALHRTLTVERELSYAAELRLPHLDDEERSAAIDRVVRAVGLTERRGLRIGKLSGGQRKRVSVALELLTAPSLLILDEPTSGLDPGLEATMMSLFQQVAHSGRVVLVTTHAMESLSRCEALLLLMRGRVVYFAAPGDALAHFGVDRFASIFSRLDEQPAAAWARAWAQSPLRRPFLQRAAPTTLRPAPAAEALSAAAPLGRSATRASTPSSSSAPASPSCTSSNASGPS